MQIRQLLIPLAASLLLSCINMAGQKPSHTCLQAAGCKLLGTLDLFAGDFGTGSVKTHDQCFDLALSEDMLQRYASWNKKSVIVTGDILQRPSIAGAAWYDIRDRRVDAVGCSANIMYVKEIERYE